MDAVTLCVAGVAVAALLYLVYVLLCGGDER